MAIQITDNGLNHNSASKALYLKKVDIAFEAGDTYVTGGTTVDIASYLPKGATMIAGPLDASAANSTNLAVYNASTGKVQLVVRSTLAEVANGVDISAFDVSLLLIAG